MKVMFGAMSAAALLCAASAVGAQTYTGQGTYPPFGAGSPFAAGQQTFGGGPPAQQPSYQGPPQFGAPLPAPFNTTNETPGGTTVGPTTYRRFGDTVLGSDGTTARTFGNTTVIQGPNGERMTCRDWGNETTCN